MGRLDISQSVVVFDLDDTLYKEADYQASGYKSVCEFVESLYGKHLAEKLEELRKSQGKDFLGEVCAGAGLPSSAKESLLWIYRLHAPTIALSPDVASALKKLEKLSKAVAILTDGRSISQRQKLKALGLEHLPAYISEECQSEKPDVQRYRKVMEDFPAATYLYVGDNPKKDFVAPNSLGWTSIGLRGNGYNVHSQTWEDLPANYLPHIWIDNLNQLLDFIC